MRVALCQIDTTVGDLAGNRRRALAALGRAAEQGAELAVLPELLIPGYPPRDLLDRPGFIDANLAALRSLVTEMPEGPAALLGFVERATVGSRPVLYNAVALARRGQIQDTFRKRLLPTYDVFDEARYFEPGPESGVFELCERRIGVTICEDIWNEADSPLRQPYGENPVADCVAAGADLLINVAASPFTLAKRQERSTMLSRVAAGRGLPLIFSNLVGGNDDILFDGSSAVYGPDGALWARLASFAEQVSVVEVAPEQPVADLPATPAAAAFEALVMGTRDYAGKCGFERAVLGLSGGIDSALVACVAARAFGPEQVLGVAMPTRYSSEGSLRDARELAGVLGIGFALVPIDPIFQSFLDHIGPTLESLGPAGEADTTFENIQARIRGTSLMAISNRLGHLLLTTGNKSELAVGYSTLYGDMAGGLAVISDLPKTFVYEVAREVNRQAGRDVVPKSTLEKPPSAELRPDQTDQDSLPPYELLDPILERLIESGWSVDAIVEDGYPRDVVQQVARMVRLNEYKRRQMPPGLIVTSKAFGPGRRYPIAQGFWG